MSTNASPPPSALALSDPDLLRTRGLVGGQWRDADGGGTFEVTNPATGAVLGTIPDMGTGENRRAIDAAHPAFPAWPRKSANDRAHVLKRTLKLMHEHQADLARQMTVDPRPPPPESRGATARCPD